MMFHALVKTFVNVVLSSCVLLLLLLLLLVVVTLSLLLLSQLQAPAGRKKLYDGAG
jgi:hypothetical protein